MAKKQPWEVLDSFLKSLNPYIWEPESNPQKPYKCRADEDRKTMPFKILENYYVYLITGFQWKALPAPSFHFDVAVTTRCKDSSKRHCRPCPYGAVIDSLYYPTYRAGEANSI